MFVPDIMHEFELGAWGKTVFPHLIRILVAQGGDVISTFNNRYVSFSAGNDSSLILHRYRSVPTFGNDTIRRFPINTAALVKLSARDYEALLKVSVSYTLEKRSIYYLFHSALFLCLTGSSRTKTTTN